MSEKIYRSAAEEELINILARIALRVAVKKQTELTSENMDKGSSEILQNKDKKQKGDQILIQVMLPEYREHNFLSKFSLWNPHMWAQQALKTPDIVVPCDYIAKAIFG